MKKTILLIFFLLSHAPFSRVVEYSEATDVFEIIDQVSMWHPSISPAMKKKWMSHFEPDKHFSSEFKEYSDLRKKYYKEPYPTKLDLFGPTKLSNNLISNAFYHSKSVSQALMKLKRKIKPSEYNFLVNFLKKLMSPISEFVKESTSFSKQVKSMDKEWRKSKAEATFKKLMKFVGIKKRTSLKIRPVWWPANERPFVDVRGNIVLLRFHPLEQKDFWDPKEVLEKLSEELLANLSPNSRENMSKIFMGHCASKKDILKISMTQLWSRIYFSKLNHKKKFTLYRIWSDDKFVDVYIKMLFPLLEETIKNKGTLEGQFIDKASAVCAQLTSL